MKPAFSTRTGAFLVERIISQAGGLALVALVARSQPTAEAAGFVAAYAFASLLQPLFANACQPLAIRLWRRVDGRDAFMSLWVPLLVIAPLFCAGAGFAKGIGDESLGAAMLFHAAVAPMALASAPFLARDDWRSVIRALLPATCLGVAARLTAAAFGELTLAAALFAVEPLVGGAILASRGGLGRRFRWSADAAATIRRAAPAMMIGMALATLFWRAPVLIAEATLSPEKVLLIAFAMQIVGGAMLAPNVIIQANVGLIAGADPARRRAAIAAAALVSCATGAGLAAVAAVGGDVVLVAIYGPAATSGALVLLLLSPLAALGGFWRLAEIVGGVDGWERMVLVCRLPALAGLGLALWLLSVGQGGVAMLAAFSTMSLLASVLAFGFVREARQGLAFRSFGEAPRRSP